MKSIFSGEYLDDKGYVYTFMVRSLVVAPIIGIAHGAIGLINKIFSLDRMWAGSPPLNNRLAILNFVKNPWTLLAVYLGIPALTILIQHINDHYHMKMREKILEEFLSDDSGKLGENNPDNANNTTPNTTTDHTPTKTIKSKADPIITIKRGIADSSRTSCEFDANGLTDDTLLNILKKDYPKLEFTIGKSVYDRPGWKCIKWESVK